MGPLYESLAQVSACALPQTIAIAAYVFMQADTDFRKDVDCVMCGDVVNPQKRVRHTQARWITYTHESGGWVVWRQVCAACLYYRWKSMVKSYDAETTLPEGYSHKQWKRRLYEKLVRESARLGNAAIEEDMFELRGLVSGEETESDTDI